MNRYLSKLASNGAPSVPKASLTAKLGLGASLAGLGIGAANYANARNFQNLESQRVKLEHERVKLQEQQKKLDEKSLSALRSISKSLGSNVQSGKTGQ